MNSKDRFYELLRSQYEDPSLLVRREMSCRFGQVSLDPAWVMLSFRQPAFDCMRNWCFQNKVNPDALSIRMRSVSENVIFIRPKGQLLLRHVNKYRVYFVQESGMGAIKIGFTQDVGARVKDLAAATPHKLTTLVTIEGDHQVERAIHRRFSHARIRGEWFRPVPELLAYIAEIKVA